MMGVAEGMVSSSRNVELGLLVGLHLIVNNDFGDPRVDGGHSRVGRNGGVRKMMVVAEGAVRVGSASKVLGRGASDQQSEDLNQSNHNIIRNNCAIKCETKALTKTFMMMQRGLYLIERMKPSK